MTQVFDGSLLENFSLFSLCAGLMFSSFQSMRDMKSMNKVINEPETINRDKGEHQFHKEDNFQTAFSESNNSEILHSPSPEVMLRIMNYARYGQKP